MAGTAIYRKPFEEWVREGAHEDELPKVLRENDDEFTALVVYDDGKCYEYDSGFLMEVQADYYAIGSGMMLALGALAHGATAEQAVAAASLHDKNTGGSITAIHFSTLN